MAKKPEAIISKIKTFQDLIIFEAENIQKYKDILPNFEKRALKRIAYYSKQACKWHRALQPKRVIKFAHN